MCGGSYTQSWVGCESPEHLIENTAPVAAVGLAEQAHRRVPRAVVAAEHPTPVRSLRKHHPRFNAERAAKMRDGCVDGDDQVQLRDQRGSVREIAQLGGVV